MREIKFRARCFNNKQWIYGQYMQQQLRPDMSGKERGHYIVSTRKPPVEIDRKTLGQYTGLKDKNGTEIYEGDIYHMGDPNITYTVVWHDTGLIGKQNGSNSYAGLSHWIDRIEVIGNVFQNGELLNDR